MKSSFFCYSSLTSILIYLASCQHSIEKNQLEHCRLFCQDLQGVHQITIDPFKGVGCHCSSEDLLWLEVGDGSSGYQEKLEISEEEQELFDDEAEDENVK